MRLDFDQIDQKHSYSTTCVSSTEGHLSKTQWNSTGACTTYARANFAEAYVAHAPGLPQFAYKYQTSLNSFQASNSAAKPYQTHSRTLKKSQILPLSPLKAFQGCPRSFKPSK